MDKLKFNLELQKEIIGLCVHDPTFFLKLNGVVTPAHFSDSTAARCYAIIQRHFNEHNVVPEVSIIQYYLSKVGDEATDDYFERHGENRDFLLDETLKMVRRQELKRFVLKAAEMVDDDEEQLDMLESEIRRIIGINADRDLGLFYYDLDERFQRILSLKETKYPIGIPSVDRVLGGGISRKELVCFAAASGVGKSFLLVIAGANMLCDGLNVVHYTLEMSEEVTSLRYDSAITHKTIDEILGDVDSVKATLSKRKKLFENNLVIKEYPTKSASVNAIRAHLRELLEQHKFIPDVIIVDYGDIMKATRSFNSRYEEQGSIFQDLRGLAQEMNVPVLSATQTNRGSLSKDVVTMEDLSDSFDKARIMDALFCMVQKPEEKEDGFFRLYDAKVRNGKAGGIHGYNIDYARVIIDEIEDDEDVEE